MHIVYVGWGTHYFNNGNQAQGAVINGTYHGQGLHFRWGDGSVFRCSAVTLPISMVTC